jgi:hypothetical protein
MNSTLRKQQIIYFVQNKNRNESQIFIELIK